MIPHPTTWQNARERERQELLVAAERHDLESRALAGSACRTLGSRVAGSPAFCTPRPSSSGSR